MATYRVLYRQVPNFRDPSNVVVREDYREVATLEAESPDAVFGAMNVVTGDICEIPVQLRIRSMSVGDLVEDVASGEVVGCCGCGWKDVKVLA